MTEVIIVSQGQLVRNIEVQSGQRTDMVLLVYPGVSCDIKLDVTLAGEGAWLIFGFLFAYAIKNKWTLLFDECSTGRVSSDYHRSDVQRRKDNWQGNVFKFTISIAVLVIHVILFFYLLK